jgi:hypothetical protein
VSAVPTVSVKLVVSPHPRDADALATGSNPGTALKPSASDSAAVSLRTHAGV